MRLTIVCFLISIMFSSMCRAQTGEGSLFSELPRQDSSIRFDVESSVFIAGTFDKWDATLIFTSADLSTGVLDIKIHADSVDTGPTSHLLDFYAGMGLSSVAVDHFSATHSDFSYAPQVRCPSFDGVSTRIHTG